MASLEVAKNAGCDPLRSFEIAIPGRTTTCMPIFYENQLRRYLQAVTKTDASPSIFYRGNRLDELQVWILWGLETKIFCVCSAVVEFQRSLQDESTGNISLVVELLLRQTKMWVLTGAYSITISLCSEGTKFQFFTGEMRGVWCGDFRTVFLLEKDSDHLQRCCGQECVVRPSAIT